MSAFAVRVVASTKSSHTTWWPRAQRLRGPRHGGHTARIESFLDELDPGRRAAAMADRLRRGESVPGRHPLYPTATRAPARFREVENVAEIEGHGLSA